MAVVTPNPPPRGAETAGRLSEGSGPRRGRNNSRHVPQVRAYWRVVSGEVGTLAARLWAVWQRVAPWVK